MSKTLRITSFKDDNNVPTLNRWADSLDVRLSTLESKFTRLVISPALKIAGGVIVGGGVGSLTLQAGGTNQNITLIPTGTGANNLQGLTTIANLHAFAGMTVGILEDPFIISAVGAAAGGSIAAGTYHAGLTSVNSTGESFSNDATVTIAAGQNAAVLTWVPIPGAQSYNVYFGSTFATAKFVTSVSGQASNTFTVLSVPTTGVLAPTANTTAGTVGAGIVSTSTVASGPTNFFLNLGNADNSQAAFFFSDHKGIAASFQTKGTGGTAPVGGKSELDVAFNGDSVQLLAPDTTNPGLSTKELDVFVNNTQVVSFRQTTSAFFQNVNLTPVTLSGTLASPLLQFTDVVAGVPHAWKLVANTSDQLEIDHDAAVSWTLDAAGNLQSGSTALALKAGGTNQNVTIIPSGTGGVGIGTTTLSTGQMLEVNGGMALNTTALQPICSATTRGTFWVVRSAAGVKDAVQVCAKDATDTYAWRVIF